MSPCESECVLDGECGGACGGDYIICKKLVEELYNGGERTSRDVFPVPRLEEPKVTTGEVGHRRDRKLKERAAVRVANEVLEALNDMNDGMTSYGSSESPTSDTTPTASQRAVQQRILEDSRAAVRTGLISGPDCGGVPADSVEYDPYSGEEPDYCEIDPELLALPKEGAGSVYLMDLVPPEVRAEYENLGQLRPVEEVDMATYRQKKPRVLVKTGKYPALVMLLMSLGMVALLATAPTAVSGQFATPKDNGLQRLVDNMVPGNLWWKDPGSLLEFGLPSDIANIVVPPGERVVCAKMDLDNYYHRFLLPKEWWLYFGLPPIWSVDIGLGGEPRWVHPVRTTLPMGWSHAVRLAQYAHCRILDLGCSLLQASTRVTGSRCPALLMGAGILHGVYVDDLWIVALESCRDLAFEAVAQAKASYIAALLVPADRKEVLPAPEGAPSVTTIIGVDVTGEGWLLPCRKKLLATLSCTRQILAAGRCTGVDMRRLIGSWVWVLLIQRPLLAVLCAVFGFAEAAGFDVRALSAVVRRELRTLLKLAPVIRVDLRAPVADVVVATDASSTGGGMAYCRATPDLAGLVEHGEVRGWHTHMGMEGPVRAVPLGMRTVIQRGTWRIGFSHRWRWPDHINIHEMRAACLGVEWLVRSPQYHGKRVPLFIDSLVALGAFAKGRSSARRLNFYCRRMAALLIASGIRPYWIWVPTELNPADEPSRR